MKVLINHIEHELPEGATLADAVRALQPRGPFAVAVNMAFVPRTLYNDTQLNALDRIELIAPVTGG
jgi:sulfur carrier protein